NMNLQSVTLGTGQMIICSRQPDQVSWELKDRPNGGFTACLIDALKAGGHQATINTVFAKLKDSVEDTILKERGTLQTPVMKTAWKGKDLILGVTPTNPHQGLSETEVAAAPAPAPPPVPLLVPVQSPPAVPIVQPVQGAVERSAPFLLPDCVAILPFAGPLHTEIEQLPSTVKVVWGRISSPQELVGLSSKLTQGVFQGLRAALGEQKVLGPRTIEGDLKLFLRSDDVRAVDTSTWKPEDFKRLAM